MSAKPSPPPPAPVATITVDRTTAPADTTALVRLLHLLLQERAVERECEDGDGKQWAEGTGKK